MEKVRIYITVHKVGKEIFDALRPVLDIRKTKLENGNIFYATTLKGEGVNLDLFGDDFVEEKKGGINDNDRDG